MSSFFTRAICLIVASLAFACVAPAAAFADADEGGPVVPGAPLPGLHPLSGPIPVATAYPGESPTVARPDGTRAAVPEVHGTTKTFHIVARAAPWTLKPGLTVMAKTYNGVVPGPTLVVDQGDRVVIDYRNELDIADTIHLHGIHGTDVGMDGVPGSSQALVPPHGTFRYTFVADQAGTFIYHTHDRKAVLNAGLYGGIIVNETHPAVAYARDYLEMISSWYVDSASESNFTLNGKEYPATRAIEVRKGERIRIRWINISAENFHTMHTHGHYMRVIARDAYPVKTEDVEDTLELGPGQRVDVALDANAKPGTWMVHCHVLDHIEDDQGMPEGLITALHYAGTPNTLSGMYDAMMKDKSGRDTMANGAPTTNGPAGKLSFGMTVLLGAIAGLTIFLGLPVARARKLKPAAVNLLNAFAIGILVYLVIEISMNAIIPVNRALVAWHAGSLFPLPLVVALAAGLVLGLVGLGAASTAMVKRSAQQISDRPLALAAIIAVGIGAHNFAEGLAIGASAASGATAVAAGLIIGFALHNATEGFGVAAPLAGKVVPSWGQIGLAGLVAGGPTFLGTIVGYSFVSPVLSVFFLATAIGALVFVIGELWSVLKKTGVTMTATSMVTAGFALAFVTEIIVDLSSGG
jgi:ZIP family zinc transporter